MRLFNNWLRRLIVGSKLWLLERYARPTRCGSADAPPARSESIVLPLAIRDARRPTRQFKVLVWA